MRDAAGSTVAAGPVSSDPRPAQDTNRSEEHTSELQSRQYLVCRLLLEKKKKGPGDRTRARGDRNTAATHLQHAVGRCRHLTLGHDPQRAARLLLEIPYTTHPSWQVAAASNLVLQARLSDWYK